MGFTLAYYVVNGLDWIWMDLKRVGPLSMYRWSKTTCHFVGYLLGSVEPSLWRPIVQLPNGIVPLAISVLLELGDESSLAISRTRGDRANCHIGTYVAFLIETMSGSCSSSLFF